MEAVESLKSIPPSHAVSVIINCSTKWTTSLSLASVLRCVPSYPVVVIDCGSTDDSKAHLAHLAKLCSWSFFFLRWPLRPHGVALDQVFCEIDSISVLLVDSDLEIRSPRIVNAMLRELDHEPRAYGAGFLNGPAWIPVSHRNRELRGYYAPRMWIPLALLKTGPVRHALANGATFDRRRQHFYPSWRPPGSLAGLNANWSKGGVFERVPLTENGESASFVEFDTGADLHLGLEAEGYRLATLPSELWGDVKHYGGVTRARSQPLLRRIAQKMQLAATDTETSEERIVDEVKERLRRQYDVPVYSL